MRGPTRRRVLQGVSAGSAVFGATHWTRLTDRGAGQADGQGSLEVSIVETDSPVNAGEYLDVTVEIRNTGSSDVRTDVDLLVGEDANNLSWITTTISAGETRTMDRGFYTYPVPEDAEFPVRVAVDGDSDAQAVSVTGAPWLSNANPGGEVTVEQGAEVLFEAAPEDPADDHEIVWWVDGEQVGAFAGPWEWAYFDETGSYFRREAFETAGTHDVAAAVISRNRDESSTAHWRVEVTAGGRGSPTVEAVRPDPGTVPVTGEEAVTFELEAADPDGRLDKVVWWLTQADVILDVTDLSGSNDTARLSTDATCHTCHITPWVVCTDGMVASPSSEWQLDRVEDGSPGTGAELDLSIRTTNSPVDAGEYLEAIVDIENTGDEVGEDVLELVVGHDPEVLDTQEIIVHPGETGAATLGFETYPTRQDEQFPIRVVGRDDAVETSVQVFAR